MTLMVRTRRAVGLSVISILCLSSCDNLASNNAPASTTSGAKQDQGDPLHCSPTVVSLRLLGKPGDSPLVPVQLRGQQAAMFFSPGIVPLLFRNNGHITFKNREDVLLRRQDGAAQGAGKAIAWGLSVGDLKPADREGYVLPEPDHRIVDGRPIVGMLGRNILPENAVVSLDMPGRLVTISTTQADCANVSTTSLAQSVDMQRSILLVAVQINGHEIQAVLEPDLPVSILPSETARRVGISDADLADDPSVVTDFGKGVLGHRHQVQTLTVGEVKLQSVAFDVEDKVSYAMLGQNFFQLGQGIFDFTKSRFSFRQTSNLVPSPTNMHFDNTRVVHVTVQEGTTNTDHP